MARSAKEAFERRHAALKQEMESFKPHWKELSDYISPARGRFFTSDRNKGNKRYTKIINGAATMARRTLVSGMMAGITSPARPWFRLATPDPEMMEYAPVKHWLASVERLMREIFNQSNLYNALPTIYHELGTFGTAAVTVVEDFNDVIRVYPHTIGSYSIANNQRLEVDVLYREFEMTVAQIVGQFAFNGNPRGKADWSGITPETKALWDNGDTEKWVKVIHAIEPNDKRDFKSPFAKDKPTRSVYLEAGSQHEKLLRQSGFDEFPSMVPRWDVTGEDVYGTDCPGMVALGDVKGLQLLEKRKAQGIDKAYNPTLSGPPSLRNVPISSLPGGITLYDQGQNKQELKPTYLVNPHLNEVGSEIYAIERRIDRAFYADLFLMLSQSDRRQITAREVEEKHEEKLLMLGPVLERLHGEFLNKLIDRTFAIMVRMDLLPPAPPELQGAPLKVEYISILAQAQRAVGIGAIERLGGYIGGLAQFNPDILDKFDMDQSVDEYGDMIGVAPGVIRTDDKVAELREQRRKQEQAQQMAAMVQPAADATQKLANAPVGDESALSRIVGL